MGSPADEGLQASRIPLKDGSELDCRIGTPEQTETKRMPQEVKETFVEKTQEKRMQVNEAQSENVRPDIVREEHVYPDIVSEEEVQTKEMPQVETRTEETRQVEVQSGEVQADEIPQEQEVAGERELFENIPSPSSRRMLEEKWEQLWGVYPHRCPFGDEREYLQIGPEDFVILRDRFYKLVHNSFLLHGFYNYQHLILARLERRGESFYYVGVPGNFYDREKQVAVMYGFESFECLKEPAAPGDFGYYMLKVEL